MAGKPRITESGLLAESYGRRGSTVTLREEKAPGTNVALDYTDANGKRPKPSLGYPVRHRDARNRWVWDWDALERAREAAEDRAAELRLGTLAKETDVPALTVGQAFALYHDPESGGMSGRASTTVYAHRRARRAWERALGRDTPWNRVTPADVQGVVDRLVKQGMAPSAHEYLKNLRTVYKWLRTMRRMKHLEDPTEGVDRAAILKEHKPKRPRFTLEDARKIVAVRQEVDPRFALFVGLMDDSGARREALRLAMRSGLDAPLDFPPSKEDAPLGWLLLPALKGQGEPLVFLTAFQRRELEAALTGYLRHLEREWLENGRDYPLFPAARIKDAIGQTVRIAASVDAKGRRRDASLKAYQPISRARTREWLIDAEKRAGVKHVEGRGYHGIRRAVSDYLHETTDLKTLTTGMAWSSERVPEQIYVDKGKHAARSRVRAAHEERRRHTEED